MYSNIEETHSMSFLKQFMNPSISKEDATEEELNNTTTEEAIALDKSDTPADEEAGSLIEDAADEAEEELAEDASEETGDELLSEDEDADELAGEESDNADVGEDDTQTPEETSESEEEEAGSLIEEESESEETSETEEGEGGFEEESTEETSGDDEEESEEKELSDEEKEEVAESLESIRTHLINSLKVGGLDEVNAQLTKRNLDMIGKRLGLESAVLMPSLEQFTVANSRRALATNLMVDTVDGILHALRG